MCAKNAHAHVVFGRLIAKSVCAAASIGHCGKMNGRISCTESKAALQLLDDSSDECVVVGCLRPREGLCRINRRTKLGCGRQCRPQLSKSSWPIHRAQEAWFSSPSRNSLA